MASLPAAPGGAGGGEPDRLASHRRHCEQARGRWASLADAAARVTGLLLGHVVSVLVVLAGLVVGIAWLLG